MGKSKIAGSLSGKPKNSTKVYRQTCWYEDVDIAYVEDVINDTLELNLSALTSYVSNGEYFFKLYDDRYMVMETINKSTTDGVIRYLLLQIDIRNQAVSILDRGSISTILDLGSYEAGWNLNQVNEHLLYFTGRYGRRYSSLTEFMDTAIYIYDDQVTTAELKINALYEMRREDAYTLRSGDVTQVDDATVILPYAYRYYDSGYLGSSYTCRAGTIRYTLADGQLTSPVRTEYVLPTASKGDKYMTSSIEVVQAAGRWRCVSATSRSGEVTSYVASTDLVIGASVSYGDTTELLKATLDVRTAKPIGVEGTDRIALIATDNYLMIDYGGAKPLPVGSVVAHNERMDLKTIKPASVNKYYYDYWFKGADGQKAMVLSADGISILREGGFVGSNAAVPLIYDTSEEVLIGAPMYRSSIYLAKYPYVETIRNRTGGAIAGITAASAGPGKRVALYKPE